MDEQPRGRRRVTIGIGSMIEAVIVCAVCAALVRHEWIDRGASGLFGIARPSELFRLLVGAVFVGLAMCGGIALTIETGRGRRPSTWGIGRWIWSVSGIYTFLAFANWLIRTFIANDWHASREMVDSTLRQVEVMTTYVLPLPLIALCTTAMIAGVLRDPDPDLREYLGRLFASLIVAEGIGWETLVQMGW